MGKAANIPWKRQWWKKLHASDLKREKYRGSVHTSKLASGSKKPIPFNRAHMFTKRLGLSHHILCENASGLFLQNRYTVMHEIQWSIFPRSDFMWFYNVIRSKQYSGINPFSLLIFVHSWNQHHAVGFYPKAK